MKKCLIIVDVQNDFSQPSGNLYVAGGEKLGEKINDWINWHRDYDLIVATQDWHPNGHISFVKGDQKVFDIIDVSYGKQKLWPCHCIMGTRGAELDNTLITNQINLIIRKGMNQNIDSYSAFFENDKTTPTGLGEIIHDASVDIVGIAYDVCVMNTARDALKFNNSVRVLKDYTVSVSKQGEELTDIELKNCGIEII
jgi:nicotinamidase/pyrazinamidase